MLEEHPGFTLPRKDDGRTQQRGLILRSAAALYSLMAAFAFAWALVRENLDLFFHPHPALALPWHAGLWGGLLAGIGFGSVVVVLTKATAGRAGWARKLLVEMKSVLGALEPKDALYLAALSAISEELFFRGVLQAHLGLVWSSVIFGLAHIPRNRVFILWTFEAVIMGFCLGLLFLYTGNLLAPIAAHFTINYWNLLFMIRYEETGQTGESTRGSA